MNGTYNLSMNFSQSACLLADDQEWVKSPADSVSRIHLEREAKEYGHTTSFVRFEPSSYFPEHSHPQGEEIYVLEGVFSDEHGEYPYRSWIRSLHMSKHFPRVEEETLILVKVGHLGD